jgi:mRNA interferase MazF
MKPGDIYWVELPPASGREQIGHRPAVILQDEIFAGGNPLVTVLPITSSIAATRFAGTLIVEPDETNHLWQASVVLVFQIRSVDRRIVKEKIGEVTPDQLTELYALLDSLTGRPLTRDSEDHGAGTA